MKTAISVPDDVFERVARHADRLGISRSEFFSSAARRWLDQIEEVELTAAIDLALDGDAGSDIADDARLLRAASGSRFAAAATDEQ